MQARCRARIGVRSHRHRRRHDDDGHERRRISGIVGEINDVALGFDTQPDASTAQPGDVNVPMLQFDVVPETDGLTINHLTLKASGTGNDVADLTAGKVWLDENGNGQVDPRFLADAFAEDNGADGLAVEPSDGGIDVQEGDRQIGSGAYDTDDGTLTLTIDPPLALGPRETATLLITYDIAGGDADGGTDAKVPPLTDEDVRVPRRTPLLKTSLFGAPVYR